MGFLNRWRGGAGYGPADGAKQLDAADHPADALGGPAELEQSVSPASQALRPAAPGLAPHAVFSFPHRLPGERTSAAERAFMDLKRGSND